MSQTLGNRIRESREKKGLTQTQAAEILGISLRSLQGHESDAHRPSDIVLNDYAQLFKCAKMFLLTGEGKQFPGEEVSDKPSVGGLRESIYRKIDTSFGTAVDALKEIFDSHDPVLIDAIRANLYAFQMYAKKDQELKQQTREIQDLKEKHKELKKVVEDLECKKGSAESL